MVAWAGLALWWIAAHAGFTERQAATAGDSPLQQCGDTLAQPPSAMAWERVVGRIACSRTQLADQLTRARTVLATRARREAPALLPRILRDSLLPVPSGYGMVPQVLGDEVERTVPITESRYSLQALLARAATDTRAGSQLALQSDSASKEIVALVVELERLRIRIRYLDDNIAYHRYWQKAAGQYTAFFAGRNALIERLQALQRLDSATRDSSKFEAMRRDLAAAVAPFAPSAGLVWHLEANDLRILPVNIVTDITDTVFLVAFENAVAKTWNESDAARTRGFRIGVRFTHLDRAAFPEGLPAKGVAIDERKHIERFPTGALVLTTGAKSTHGIKGRYVQLGASAVSARVLAHEFGHLLGFDDAYLRGTEGNATLPYGFTIVEWTGIQDDLMGAPGFGRVTMAMIDTLVAAYKP